MHIKEVDLFVRYFVAFCATSQTMPIQIASLLQYSHARQFCACNDFSYCFDLLLVMIDRLKYRAPRIRAAYHLRRSLDLLLCIRDRIGDFYRIGHRLRAAFSDGTSGEHDFSALVAETGPMVELLRDPA